jgi:Rrf2 family protein
MRNTRFAVALHILTLLAVKRDEALTSEFIAGSVQTNAVVIRRLLSRLREAGLVRAVQGPGGGFTLAGDANDVTLRDIYEAVEEAGVLLVHAEANAKCPVGRNVGTILGQVMEDAEKAMLASLAERSLASLARKVNRLEKAG